MASDRNEDECHPSTQSFIGTNLPAVTMSNHFPTVREFVSSMNPQRELTIQPLTDHSLQPTRPAGFMNLREKLLLLFQEEAEKACRENPKYQTLTLKGRLSLTINDMEKIFIDIYDLYPHQNESGSEPILLSSTLDLQTNLPKPYTVPAAPDIGLSPSLIDRVTSLGQIELIRRYNANQLLYEESSQTDVVQQPQTVSVSKPQDDVSSHVYTTTPQCISISEENNVKSTTGEESKESRNKPTNNSQDDSINPSDESETKNPDPKVEPSNNTIVESTIKNPENLKCYLCEDVLPDCQSLLLHVEKHCQTLTQKCLEDDTQNTLYHHLKDSGISFSENIKPDVKPTSIKTKTSKKSTEKSQKPTKTKKKSVEISYIDDEDDFEDHAMDSYSDDEKNDPSFMEETVPKTIKRKSGPSTRSRVKSSTPKRKSDSPRKSDVTESVPENTGILAQINPEDIPDLPLPKNMKHTNTGLAPFIARPVKKKLVAKKMVSRTTPKMSLKIRMKEKAKELAIKTANQAAQNLDLDCKECQKKFTNRKAYFRHIRRHDIKKCVCDICGKEFSTLDSLSHHQRGLHNAIKPYSCEECGKSFNFHHSYKLHKQKHSGSRPYKCESCGKSYLTSSHLKAHHTAVHSQLKKDKFICSMCGKAFNYQNSLKTHLMIHSGERPYKCEQCQKGFVSRQALRTHESSYHVTSKNFKCDVCNKFYKSEMLLNVHKRRHTTDVSRFMCDICGRQFMFKSNLESHKYVHQEGRPFSCDTCGKSFKCMSSLYTHQYTHKQDTPFKCRICGKGFKTKNCCKAHERRHSAEKSFICPTCGSSFPDKGGLSKHVRTIHNPQKHFVCKLCNKVGTRADNMRTHVKSHGKDIGQDNVENFIVEVLNAEGMQLIDQASKVTPNKVKPSTGQFQSPDHQPASTINYSQIDMYQAASTIQNHGASNSSHSGHHHEGPHHLIQQHYSSPHGHNMLPHHNIQHGHPGSSHSSTPPITQSNNSMTPPIPHTVTPTPQIPQSMSPPVMQVNPSTAYTTLHPLTTETLAGLSSQYPLLYAPYKHQ